MMGGEEGFTRHNEPSLESAIHIKMWPDHSHASKRTSGAMPDTMGHSYESRHFFRSPGPVPKQSHGPVEWMDCVAVVR